MNLHKAFEECLSHKDDFIHCENDGDFFAKTEGDTLKIFLEWSDDKADWRNNFKFLAIPWKPYKSMKNIWFCHRGFRKVWKAIKKYIEAAIMNPDIKKIEIVGYSHGAAIALLCYEFCKFNRPDCDIQGVGFGCPRVFWGFIPASLKERVKGFKVVRNGNDIVTHVPPALFGFRHISEMVKIGESKRKGAVKDFFRCVFRRDKQGIKDALIRLVCAKDHYSGEYKANLKQ